MTLKLGTQSVTGRLGTIVVTAAVPGKPEIDSALFNGIDTVVNLVEAVGDNGSAITGYRLYVADVFAGTAGTASQFELTFAGVNALDESVTVSAVSAAGEGPQSEPATVIAV